MKKSGLELISPRKMAFVAINSLLFALFMVIGKASTYKEMSDFEFWRKLMTSGVKWTVAFFVALFLLYTLMDAFRKKDLILTNKAGDNRFVPYEIIPFACRLPYLFFWFPGATTNDGATQFIQAVSGSYSNHHPLIYTFLIRALCKTVGHSGDYQDVILAVSLIQMIISAIVIGHAIRVLERFGVQKIWMYLLLIIYSVASAGAVMSVMLQKDTLAALCFFEFGVCLAELHLSEKINQSLGKWFWIRFTISGTLMALFRHNQFYVLIPIGVLLVCLTKVFRRQTIIAVAVSIIFGWAGNSLLPSALGCADIPLGDSVSQTLQQITAVLKYDGQSVDASDMEFLEELYDIEIAVEVYDAHKSDNLKDLVALSHEGDYIKENLAQYFGVWIRLGIQHPAIYLRAWSEMTSSYYCLFEDCFIYPTDDSTLKEYGIYNTHFNSESWRAYVSKISILWLRFGGRASVVWILIISALFAAYHKCCGILYLYPIINIALVCVSTPINNQLRYIYGSVMLAPVLIIIALIDLKNINLSKKRNNYDTSKF